MSRALGKIQSFVYAGSVMARRDVSSVAFNPRATYKKKLDKKEDMLKLVYDYCAETGLDDLGADKAEVFGPAHEPQKGEDDEDPWERLTVKLFDKDGKAMKLKGDDGQDRDRIHVATDPKNWHKKGYFKKA